MENDMLEKYDKFIKKYSSLGIINFKGIRGKSKANKNQKKLIHEAEDELWKLTDFAPENYTTKDRMQLIRAKITSENFKCPVCSKPRIKSNGMNKFSITCGKKDKEHVEYAKKVLSDRLRKPKKCPVCGIMHNNRSKAQLCGLIDDEHKHHAISYQQSKYKNTLMEKYGVENVSQLETTKEKKKKKFLEKYGVENPSQLHFNLDNFKNLNKEFIENNFIIDGKYVDFEKMEEYLGCSIVKVKSVLKEFGIKYKRRIGVSKPEKEILDFIKTIDPDVRVIMNSKTIIPPKELDLYLPDYNLAIEYNGLMFHSQGVSKHRIFNTPLRNRNEFLIKTKVCEKKGIQLLHINENEWLDDKLNIIWKSVIRNKLRKNTISIGARKCFLRKLVTDEDLKLSANFFYENHLQGAGALGSIRYGLFYEGELISCMTFGKTRFRRGAYELIRFANKINYSVPGAASKLLKAFRQDHSTIIVSYANRRWSDGNLYKTLGFKLEGISSPNYYYFHQKNKFKLWHRASFQKHKLKDKLKVFDPKLTEAENMFNNGFRRIFDAGNYVFILEEKG